MAAPKINPRDVLIRLRDAVTAELQELEFAYESKPVAHVAWLARNLMELNIWVGYCSASEENSTRFGEDSIRDLKDALTVSDEFSNDPSFSFKTAKQKLIDAGSQDGIEDIDERFTDVRQAVELLGFSLGRFRDMNKLLSKFAHPTALSVMLSQDAELMRDLFYQAGKAWGTDALQLLSPLEEPD
jgi:hypothetical protein